MDESQGSSLLFNFFFFWIVTIFCLLYSWHYCRYILQPLFLVVLPLCLVRYNHGSTTLVFRTLYYGRATLIFRTLYSCLYEVLAPVRVSNHSPRVPTSIFYMLLYQFFLNDIMLWCLVVVFNYWYLSKKTLDGSYFEWLAITNQYCQKIFVTGKVLF